MHYDKSPAAFFDTLEEMPNPFKSQITTLPHLIEGAQADALQDINMPVNLFIVIGAAQIPLVPTAEK